jgi:hypothetical protein
LRNKAWDDGMDERIVTYTRYCSNVYQAESEMLYAEVMVFCMLKGVGDTERLK